MERQKARAIELLDCRTLIKTKDWPGEAFGEGKPTHMISSRNVETLAQAMGGDPGGGDGFVEILSGYLEDWLCDRLEVESEGPGQIRFWAAGVADDGTPWEGSYTYAGPLVIHW